MTRMFGDERSRLCDLATAIEHAMQGHVGDERRCEDGHDPVGPHDGIQPAPGGPHHSGEPELGDERHDGERQQGRMRRERPPVA